MKKFNGFNEKQMEIVNEPSIQSWINEFSKHSTREQYKSRIVRFLQATNTTAEDLQRMDVKEIKKLFLTYQAQQVEKGAKNNGILSIITAMRSYLISLDKRVDFRKGQLVNLEADNDSHVFTNGDLRLLFEVGDTFEKALISTATSEGWEISAFLEQDRDIIEKRLAHAIQNNEKFIFFCNTRQKTGVGRFCVLNPLAVEWVTKYLALRTEKDKEERSKLQKKLVSETDLNKKKTLQKKLEEYNRLFPITQDGVQKLLYRLSEQAGLKTTGSLRFHNIRKWLMSRLSRCSFNEFQIKYLMGKSIGISDSTYLQTLQIEIEEKYPRVYNDYLNIIPQLNTNKEELEKLIKLKTEFDTTKAQFVEMIIEQKKINEKQEAQIKEMYAFVHRNLDPLLDVIDEISNTPEGADLIKKLQVKKLEEEYEKSKTKD